MNFIQKHISIVGAGYIHMVVPDLVRKAYEGYCMREVSEIVSYHENIFSTAAILLTVVSLESYINRISYFTEVREHNCIKSVLLSFKKEIDAKDMNMNLTYFEEILNELFIVRDLIVHNHIYEVSHNKNELKYDYVSGGDSKFKRLKPKNGFSPLLNFHVLPDIVDFGDLITALICFDLFLDLSLKILPYSGYVPLTMNVELEKDKWANDLAEFISYYYHEIKNNSYKDKLSSFVIKCRDAYGLFDSNYSAFYTMI